LTIQQAAELLGVSTQTVRRWEKTGKLPPANRTIGGQRRYNPSALITSSSVPKQEAQPTLPYARVSSHDQKDDLARQENILSMFCASHGWTYEVISDLGSGLNYYKRGLKKLIQKILNKNIKRLVITHKDRLLRFGSELIFSLCEERGIEVVLINQGKEPSFEEELASDVFEIITVFSARLYGSRSRKNKTLLKNLKEAVDDTHKGDKSTAKSR